MANTKISQLTATVNPTGNEELVYAYNNANGKMTLDTMKTFVQPDLSGYATTSDLSGKQDTLVSGTNIKTINGNSILGSGNLVISGGGGGQEVFDCIVDADGNGDYTTLYAAVTAGNRNIFIREGNYTETPITLVDDSFTIVGANAEGVILNYSITAVSGDTGGACISFSTSTKTNKTDIINHTISGITFKIAESGTSDYDSGYLINSYGASSNPIYTINISNCNMIVTQTGAAIRYYDCYTSGGNNTSKNINNCNVTVHNENYDTMYYGTSGGFYNNCYLGAYTASNNNVDCHPSGYFSLCRVESWTDGTGLAQLTIGHISDSMIIVTGKSSNTGFLSLSDAINCNISIKKGYSNMQGMTASTEITVWAENTAYAVGAFVQYGSAIYKCNTAHTSSANFYNDTSNWDVFKGHSISYVCDCDISSADVLKVSGICTGNNIDSCDNIIVIGDSEGHNVKTNFSNNFTLSNSATLLKVVGQLAVVCGNGLKINYGIRYQDGYHVIKNNILTSDSSSDYPTVTLVGANNNKSKVSDNILRYRQDD